MAKGNGPGPQNDMPPSAVLEPEYAVGKGLITQDEFNAVKNEFFAQSELSVGLIVPLICLAAAVSYWLTSTQRIALSIFVIVVSCVLYLVAVERRFQYRFELKILILGLTVDCGTVFGTSAGGSGPRTVQIYVPGGCTFSDAGTNCVPGDYQTVNLGGSGGNSSWAWTFTKSFFSKDFLKTAWESAKSENGCGHKIAETFLSDMAPFPLPTDSNIGGKDVAEVGTRAASLFAYSSAINHAASSTNVLGGTGLLNPFKSSTFRSLLGLSKTAEEVALPLAVVLSTGHAVIGTGVAAYNGECY